MVLIKPSQSLPRRRRPSRGSRQVSKSSSHSPSTTGNKDKQHWKPHRRRLARRPHPPLKQVDREELAEIAEDTLSVIQSGSYVDNYTWSTHDITYEVSASIRETCIYASSSTGLIDNWQDGPRLLSSPPDQQTHVEFLPVSPLKGACQLAQAVQDAGDSSHIGFLNCCSAKRPGGSFLKGGIELEECLARASTISASLTSLIASPFYHAHRHDDGAGFYDHQVIYTPHVVLLREGRRPDDRMETGGGNFIPPLHMSVVSSCAINAQQLRSHLNTLTEQRLNEEIESVMRTRMARILRVFEERGIRNLLLVPFGVGRPFNNNVEIVARIWAELLACPNAAFKHVFNRVWFALDYDQHFLPRRFQQAFRNRVFEDEFNLALTEDPEGEDWERVF